MGVDVEMGMRRSSSSNSSSWSDGKWGGGEWIMLAVLSCGMLWDGAGGRGGGA